MTGMKDMTRFFRSAVPASAKKYIVDAEPITPLTILCFSETVNL